LPSPNFNVYITQKLFVALLKDLPGINQSGGLSYKRLDGDWIISEIRYVFDGKKQTQKITLLKRNLELLENEKLNELPRQTKKSVDNSEGNYENELSPFDSPPNDPTSTNEQITPSSEPGLVTDSNLERVVNQSSDLKDNSGVLRNLVVIDNKSVDERVAQPFISMRDAALKDGVKLVINSAFRPAFGKKFTGTTSKGKSIEITTQESLRRAHAPSGKKNDEDFIFKGKSKQFSPETAAPGKSNHGNGIALDLNTGSRSKKTLNEKVYIWLIKNSWRFGFVRTVASEEWHFELRPDISSKGPYAVLKSTERNLFYSDLGLNNLNF
jgi:LAS superfamily LD-carboxypeptidase LdcB